MGKKRKKYQGKTNNAAANHRTAVGKNGERRASAERKMQKNKAIDNTTNEDTAIDDGLHGTLPLNYSNVHPTQILRCTLNLQNLPLPMRLALGWTMIVALAQPAAAHDDALGLANSEIMMNLARQQEILGAVQQSQLHSTVPSNGDIPKQPTPDYGKKKKSKQSKKTKKEKKKGYGHHLRGLSTENPETKPAIAITSNGTVAIAYEKKIDGKDQIQIKNNHGVSIAISPAGKKSANPSIIAVDSNTVHVTWSQNNLGSEKYDIESCVVNVETMEITSYDTVNANPGSQKKPDATIGATVYEDTDGCSQTDSNGTSTIASPCDAPKIITTDHHNVIAMETDDGISVQTQAQDGAKLQQLQIAATAAQPDVAKLSSDTIAITYTNTATNTIEVVTAKIESDANIHINGTARTISAPSESIQSGSSIVELPNGIAVVYNTNQNNEGQDCYIAFFDSSGSPVGAPTNIHNTSTTNNQQNPVGVYNENGDVIIAYENQGDIAEASINVPANLTQAATSGPSSSTTTTGSTTSPSGSGSPTTTTDTPAASNGTKSSSALDRQQSAANNQSSDPESTKDQKQTQSEGGISSDMILGIIAIIMVSVVGVYGVILCAGLYCTSKKKPATTKEEDDRKAIDDLERGGKAVTVTQEGCGKVTVSKDGSSDSDGYDYGGSSVDNVTIELKTDERKTDELKTDERAPKKELLIKKIERGCQLFNKQSGRECDFRSMAKIAQGADHITGKKEAITVAKTSDSAEMKQQTLG